MLPRQLLIITTTKDLPKLIASVVFCELAGLLGTPFTAAAIPTWYALLAKPPFSPPTFHLPSPISHLKITFSYLTPVEV